MGEEGKKRSVEQEEGNQRKKTQIEKIKSEINQKKEKEWEARKKEGAISGTRGRR